MTVYPPIIVKVGRLCRLAVSDALGIGHLCGTGGTPTLATTGLTTGATATLTAGSTDLAGEIVVTTGLVSIGVGMVLTLTFATPYANRPWAQVSGTSASINSTATTVVITSTVALAVSSTTRIVGQVVGQVGG